MRHHEKHRATRAGWLRATVLGANDGIVSTASLIMGVASAQAVHTDIVIAGVAGLVAGAMSMAAGEYVSVSSQADSETADLARERKELETDDVAEHRELAEIYVTRGLDRTLAKQVAEQLMAHDALAAHARDELGISDMTRARPLQAAFASALAFSIGAALPLGIVFLAPQSNLIPWLMIMSLVFLASLGGFAARVGGASVWRGVLRVTFWGALAMVLTALVGSLFDVAA
jgi:VIT1/CCC1 family predicted Fe2+/Mn2+ transporter